MKNLFFIILGTFLALACSDTSSDREVQIREKALSFAESYFNYDFKEAQKHVTSESVKWLKFAASNMTQEDIDKLNSQEDIAHVEFNGFLQLNDTAFIITVTVSNFLKKDSVSTNGVMIDKASFPLKVVERDGKHYVRMEALPQSERQSLD